MAFGPRCNPGTPVNRFAECASCPEGCPAQPSILGLGHVPELPIMIPVPLRCGRGKATPIVWSNRAARTRKSNPHSLKQTQHRHTLKHTHTHINKSTYTHTQSHTHTHSLRLSLSHTLSHLLARSLVRSFYLAPSLPLTHIDRQTDRFTMCATPFINRYRFST